jgi:hypothetical protein
METIEQELKGIKEQLTVLMEHLGVGTIPQRSRLSIRQEVKEKLQKRANRSMKRYGGAQT